jgi:hypothetical protein
MGGVIWAYGNKTIAPYSEQFYVGGANSIRAFTVRSIGPGRFHPANNSGYSYVDETGDIKLEANLEYRFRIFSNFLRNICLYVGNQKVKRFRRNIVRMLVDGISRLGFLCCIVLIEHGGIKRKEVCSYEYTHKSN